ncbi:MAG: DUF6798 domain-containing protein [Acidobacteriota bacterium]
MLLLFILVTVLGSPFEFDESENTRYMLPVLQAADPSLFPNDSVVSAIAGFRSAFYEGLIWGIRAFGVSADSVATVYLTLYVLVKTAMVGAMFWVVRVLGGTTPILALFAALCCLTKVVPLGGTAIFGPRLTHIEVAMVLDLLALGCFLKNKPAAAWLAMSIAVFIHPLVTLHLAIVLLPFLLHVLRQRPQANLAGGILFGAACISYYLVMAPPPMSAAEREIFLTAKGANAHISMFSQELSGWVMIVLALTIVTVGCRRFFDAGENLRLLVASALWGSLAALMLSGLTVVTGSYRLAQIQPMRLFHWVWLLVMIVLAFLTIKAFVKRPAIGVLLSAFCVFVILESLWALAFAAAIVIIFVAHPVLSRWYDQQRLDRFLGAVSAAGLILPITVWTIAGHLPFESFRDWGLLAPCLALLAALWASKESTRLQVVTAAFGFAVVRMILYSWETSETQSSRDWMEVRQWVESHTPPAARFVIPSDGIGFRLIARRTAVNEPMSAIAWVAPLEYARNQHLVDQAQLLCGDATCDLPALLQFAREQDATFVILRGKPADYGVQPLAVRGSYMVLQIQNLTWKRPL